MSAAAASRSVEQAARTSYGLLLAYLSSGARDVGLCEDALADAFRLALETWPVAGVPERPEAWLLTAARRRLIDGARRARTRGTAGETLLLLTEEAVDRMFDDTPFPDRRLQLMFICAHPAIDRAIHAPLMLQTVLGFDAARIASVFMVAPATMGQRLARAKAKIRDAGIGFTMPAAEDLPERIGSVLDAIYAAYGSGWEDRSGAGPQHAGLTDEAIWLGRVLVALLPGAPEGQGLLALMLHCEARGPARRDSSGGFVPLSEQDVRLWSPPMIAEAEALLRTAGAAGRPGRYQIEAAIQSVHAARRVTGRTDWETIALLYEGLVRHSASIGALVGRAAAIAEARGPERGLACLDAIPTALVASHQPYWACAAHLLARSGRVDASRAAYDRAIGLSSEPAVRTFLTRRRDTIG